MATESKSFGFAVMMVVGVVVVVAAIMGIMNDALRGAFDTDMSEQAVAARISPAGQLNTGEPMVAEAPAAPARATQASAGGTRTGEQVYNQSCTTCHAAGVAGAPIVGNADDWAPRIGQGMETLMKHTLGGLNAMPPKGTCATCSDEELKSAVEYMVKRSS